MPEYIYIREVNKSSVHIGRTTDLEERYKIEADQTIEDFKEYLFIFECEEGKGSEIERDVKTKFKEYIVSHTNKNEQYLWNEVLKEKYTHHLRIHKYIIRQLEDDEVLKYNKNKQQTKIVVKEKQGYKPRNLKELRMTRKKLMSSSQSSARSIQKDNSKTKDTEHDEHYTRYEDIEKTVEIFKDQFKGKVVFCNCDDPLGRPCKDNEDIADCDERNCSAFALYFKKNFKKLGLKKLICLHFAGLTDIFNIGETIGMIYKFDGKPPIRITREKGFNGSFYDQKSIDILNNEADIVCTNHPWSLTERFYKILFQSNKKFLVISNAGIVLIPSFFNIIKNRKMIAIGYCKNFLKGKLRTPVQDNGAWFTNLDYKRQDYNQNKLLPLKEIKIKDEELRKKTNNQRKIIEVDDKGCLLFNNCYIPNDYDLPFAISLGPIINGILENGFEVYGNETYLPKINGKTGWRRLLIKKSKK